jgi:hypothetical protein
VRRLCHEQHIDGCDNQKSRPDQPKPKVQCVAIHERASACVAPAPNGLSRDWSLTRVAAGRVSPRPGYASNALPAANVPRMRIAGEQIGDDRLSVGSLDVRFPLHPAETEQTP